MTSRDNSSPSWIAYLAALGPAVIVASVVLGPGSILANSRVGVAYGYSMAWLLVLACVLMAAMMALAARLGVGLERTFCAEVAHRAGRPLAVLVGVCVFLICGCFQFGNNLGVITAAELVLAGGEPLDGGAVPVNVVLPIAVNLVIIVTMLRLRHLYRVVERVMMALVLLMLVGFAVNLLFSRPSIADAAAGLVPRLPDDAVSSLIPRRAEGGVVDPIITLQAMLGTTLSAVAAIYQAYAVREKGWKAGDVRRGMIDTAAGITVLGSVSLMIMFTSAAVLHGRIAPTELRSAADVARQLEPLFGSASRYLFGLGLFAAAFSSFWINALIGGTLLADGLGLNPSIDARPARLLTCVALLMGLGVALWSTGTGRSPVNLIIFAQAVTVVGGPVLVGSMLLITVRRRGAVGVRIPAWPVWLTGIAFVMVLFLAVRTAITIVLRL